MPLNHNKLKVIKMKDRWEELCKKKVNEISDTLVRAFDDGEVSHRFSVNRIEPFGYATMPITIDYTLFADIERTDRKSGNHETFRDVSLGAYFNSGPRKLIPFGERYFDSTYCVLIEIVGSEFKSDDRYKQEAY